LHRHLGQHAVVTHAQARDLRREVIVEAEVAANVAEVDHREEIEIPGRERDAETSHHSIQAGFDVGAIFDTGSGPRGIERNASVGGGFVVHVANQAVQVEERKNPDVALQVGVEHVAGRAEVEKVTHRLRRIRLHTHANVGDLNLAIAESGEHQRDPIRERQHMAARASFVGHERQTRVFGAGGGRVLLAPMCHAGAKQQAQDHSERSHEAFFLEQDARTRSEQKRRASGR
jgi:hypothetical protein